MATSVVPPDDLPKPAIVEVVLIEGRPNTPYENICNGLSMLFSGLAAIAQPAPTPPSTPD